MKSNWQNITNSGNCPPLDKLVLYHTGKLTRDENFAIENHLASCEICNDILEGLAGLKNIDSLGKIEEELKKRLKKTLYEEKSKQRRLYQRLALAASILLILGISVVVYKNLENPVKPVAQTVSEEPLKIIEKSGPGKAIKENSTGAVKHLKNKNRINNSAKRKESKKDLAMSEIQFEEDSKERNAETTNMTDSVKTVSPVVSEPDKFIAEDKKSDDINEKPEMSQGRGAKISYESSKASGNVINGSVTDVNGSPLPGVNVMIKGTSRGVTTDFDGHFTITLDNPQDILAISYIGYKSQELTAANIKPGIKLEEEVTALNEVVVVGYGVQKKSVITGSVALADEKKFKDVNHTEGKSLKELENIKLQIDSLEKIGKNNPGDLQTLKMLIEKYLEIQNKEEALKKLGSLYEQTTNMEQKKNIDEIIQLTREEKYSKALKKLKKLK